MKVGSLFSGIGGLDLALEAFGHEVVWQAECDPYARAVLAKHWPSVHCYRDVKEIDDAAERPDIICGGFPCQDISNAGRRVGIDGERSGLWSEFARIIRDLRPGFVFVENVAALTVRGLDRVLGDLASLGFDAEWDVLRAADVGAPHLRARIFILAYTQRDPRDARRPGDSGESSRRRDVDRGALASDVSDANSGGREGERRAERDGCEAGVEDPRGNVADRRGGARALAHADGETGRCTTGNAGPGERAEEARQRGNGTWRTRSPSPTPGLLGR